MKLPSAGAVIAAMIMACLASTAGAQDNIPALDTKLPITLDADSSEFDIKNGKLTFTGLRISQGALGIEAEAAEASKLDFEDSVWVFTGNVVIDNAGTQVFCDRAEINFKDHRLMEAVVTGEPARFLQPAGEDSKPKQGRASVMEYDLSSGIIRMVGDAWLSDGSNEISGARISYDIVNDYIIADGEDGQVSMKIDPPETESTAEPEADQEPLQADP